MAPIAPDADARIARFNRTCRITAAAWLLIALPVSLYLRPAHQDFTLYYIAGVTAARGEWSALYPSLPADSPDLQFNSTTTLNPRQAELAREYGATAGILPYLQPPWNALLFAPLGLLPFKLAHAVWIAVLIGSVLYIAVLAGRTFELSASVPSRLSGIATLVVAISPLAYRTIRVGNVSGAVGAAIALAVMDLMRRDSARAGIATWLGGVLKLGATVGLVPLMLVLRRWKALGWLVGLTIVTVLATLAIAGRAPFREYMTVAPEVAKSTPRPSNQALHAFLIRATGMLPLPRSLLIAMRVAQALVLVAILALMFRRRRADWQHPPIVFAAAVALVAWTVIFAPLFWEHYLIYFAPFWGWLIWEGTRSRFRATLVLIAIAMMWMPFPALVRFRAPEPIASYLLWPVCIMLGIAMDRLARGFGRHLRHTSPCSAEILVLEPPSS
jgi:hypothetical protein